MNWIIKLSLMIFLWNVTFILSIVKFTDMMDLLNIKEPCCLSLKNDCFDIFYYFQISLVFLLLLLKDAGQRIYQIDN